MASAIYFSLRNLARVGIDASLPRLAGFLFSAVSWVAPIIGLAVGICMSSTGFYFQTEAFGDGTAVLVCTAAAVASMTGGRRTQGGSD